jgi:hypothetical protein
MGILTNIAKTSRSPEVVTGKLFYVAINIVHFFQTKKIVDLMTQFFYNIV